MKTWKCPVCEDAVRGPNQPRKDDIRRYCLPCSEEHQVLVFRVKYRDRKKFFKSLKITNKKREKNTFDGVDLDSRISELIKLDIWKSYFKKVGKPEFQLRRSKTREYITGTSWRDDNKFSITVGSATDLAELESIIIHEMAHLFNETCHNHTVKWKKIYATAIKQAHGIDLFNSCADFTKLTIVDLDDSVAFKLRCLDIVKTWSSLHPVL